MERNTRQRSAIREAIAQAERPLLPQEVLDAAQLQVPGLGIATVYRTVKAMLAQEEIVSVHLPGDNPYYEQAGLHHHHHFRCRKCDQVFELHGCPAGLTALTPKGFAVESHEITLRGLCASCNT